MSAVLTIFNVSEKDPHIAISKNCNDLISMNLVLSVAFFEESSPIRITFNSRGSYEPKGGEYREKYHTENFTF